MFELSVFFVYTLYGHLLWILNILTILLVIHLNSKIYKKLSLMLLI